MVQCQLDFHMGKMCLDSYNTNPRNQFQMYCMSKYEGPKNKAFREKPENFHELGVGKDF